MSSGKMMLKKKTLNLSVPAELLKEFDAMCGHYGHGKQKGMVLSAAMLMFLRTDPTHQGQCLKEIAVANIESGVARLIDHIRKEQGLRVALHEAAAGRPDTAVRRTRPAKAAKKAGDAKRSITSLPRISQTKKRHG